MILENKFLCCSTVLNPEYRNLGLCNENEKAKIKDFSHEFIKDYFKNTVQNSLNNHNDIIRSSQLSTSSSADSFYG